MTVTIYQWAKSRGIVPQQAYSWRRAGLPVDARGHVDPLEADKWLASHDSKPVRVVASRTRAIHNSVTDISSWVSDLKRKEPESVARAFASLGFLRSQGRTLEKGSQATFIDFVCATLVPSLISINADNFDVAHSVWVDALRDRLRTNAGGRLSYGQAQKSLNVFLKFFVDWASQPDSETAARLRPVLHCPLDEVVMSRLADDFPSDYRQRVGTTGRARFSLSGMDESAYLKWQSWIRVLSPGKPVLVDVIWAFDR